MRQSAAVVSFGAVAALLVATAPGAARASHSLLWHPIAGRPLIAWPLQALAQLDGLGYCALIAPPDRYNDAVAVLQNVTPAQVNVAIPSASLTWRGALASVVDLPASCAWVIALDATLPLVTAASLRNGLRAAQRGGIAIAGEPVKETLKRVNGARVVETPPRDTLRRLHPPIIFPREALERALDARSDDTHTETNDLFSLAQGAGSPLVVFDAAYPCVRIRSDEDLAIVETLLHQQQSEASPS